MNMGDCLTIFSYFALVWLRQPEGMNIRFQLFIFLFIIAGFSAFAQGSICSNIEPFCAGDQRLTFPNSNSTNSSQISGEFGPDYGCLEEQPYPAWFFLQVEDNGNLRFRISQNSREDGRGVPLDVDFVVWGPFQRGEDYCSAANLSASNQVDCSYLPDSIETMTIPNARENEIYVVVITNFDQVPGFISLEQTNSGEGSTDCSILEFDLGEDIAVCGEDEYLLDGTSDEDAEYQWFKYDESSMNYVELTNETGPTLLVTEEGDYKLIVTDVLEDKTEEDEINVSFYDVPEVFPAEDLAKCDSGDTVDLTLRNSQLLGDRTEVSDFTVNFYESSEAAGENDAISNPRNFPFEEGKQVFARVMHNVSGCLSEIESFNLTIFDFPEYSLAEKTVLCVNLSGAAIGRSILGEDLGEGYEYEWILDGNIVSTEARYTLTELPGNGILEQNIIHDESGCFQAYSTIIQPVSRPETLEVNISGSDFGDGYVINLEAIGGIGQAFASYEYRLDGGDWRSSPKFKDVRPGNHVAYVRETNGCGETKSASFFLVGYPRFFTPNGDGFNDEWQLITDQNIEIHEVMIFDRYGKSITELKSGEDFSWDGTTNGRPLPETDYWFKVIFSTSDKAREEFMANFSLIR